MPRRRSATATRALCATHGDRCRLGGGSGYVSALCRPQPPETPCAHHGWDCRWAGGDEPATPRCEPMMNASSGQTMAELDEVFRADRVQRAVAKGVPAEVAEREAEAQRQAEVAEREAEAARCAKLTPRQIDAELHARWSALSPETRAKFPRGLTSRRRLYEAELAEMIRAHQLAAIAERAAAKVVEDAERAIDAAADQQNRHHSPQDRLTLVPGTSDTPAPIRARPRRPRRPRGPRLTVIQTVYDDDEETLGHDDRF